MRADPYPVEYNDGSYIRTASSNVPTTPVPVAYHQYCFDTEDLTYQQLNSIIHDFGTDSLIVSGLYGWLDKHSPKRGIKGYLVLDSPLTHQQISLRFKYVSNWFPHDPAARAYRIIDYINNSTFNVYIFGLINRHSSCYNVKSYNEVSKELEAIEKDFNMNKKITDYFS